MKNMKKNVLLAAAVSVSPVAAIAAEVSGNVSLTSDYRFRGISQTQTQTAVQGGFDFAFENGIYIGAWGSNVDTTDQGSMELDYYVGFAGDFSDMVSYDVGLMYYDYPGDSKVTRTYSSDVEQDYAEIYGKLGISDFTIGFAYTDDYYQETGEFFYIHGEYTFTMPGDYILDVHMGYNDFEYGSKGSNLKKNEKAFLANGQDSYVDYSIGITKEFVGIDVGLSVVGTDLSDKECWGENYCDDTVVFSLSKSL